MNNWISVEDKLPDEDYVLVVSNGHVRCATYHQSKYKQSDFWCEVNYDNYGDVIELDGVTHWQPLPEPPKE